MVLCTAVQCLPKKEYTQRSTSANSLFRVPFFLMYFSQHTKCANDSRWMDHILKYIHLRFFFRFNCFARSYGISEAYYIDRIAVYRCESVTWRKPLTPANMLESGSLHPINSVVTVHEWALLRCSCLSCNGRVSRLNWKISCKLMSMRLSLEPRER